MNRQQRTQEKHKAEAKAKGLTLLGPGKDTSHRTYRFIKCGHETEYSVSHVRHCGVECRQCTINKWTKEAKEKDLTLIGPGTKRWHYIYRFNSCKHKTEYKPAHVRATDMLTCDICFTKTLGKEAKGKGFTLIGKAKKTKTSKRTGKTTSHTLYRHYQCNECNHELDIQYHNFRKGNPECPNCFETKLNNEAAEADLIYVGPPKNGRIRHRAYQFNGCKHYQDIQIGNVPRGHFGCATCQRLKHELEAREAGLTIIGKPDNADKNSLRYRFNECEHERDIKISHVRDGFFSCHDCEETALDLPSNVYLLAIKVGSFEWTKLGHSKAVDERQKFYGLPKGAEIRTVIVQPFDTGREALEYENLIHKKYRRSKLPLDQMKKYHTRNGFDECYPIELMENLSKEVSEMTNKQASSK